MLDICPVVRPSVPGHGACSARHLRQKVAVPSAKRVRRPASSLAAPSYPMRTVARLTGLTADTIRVWERRHGAVVPHRTGGNARRYTEEDVQRLRMLREGVLGGRSIGELVELSREALAALTHAAPQASAASALVTEYLESLAAFDLLAAESLLARALLLPPRTLVFEVAAPILRAIGAGWAKGKVSVAEEHLASFQLRTLFAAALGGRRASPRAEGVIFAAPEGHAHELGVLMAAALGLECGARPVVLGANTPASAIALAAERTHASLVVLGVARSMDAAEKRRLNRSLSGLPRALPLWVGAPSGSDAGWPARARVFTSLESLDEALRVRFGTSA